MKKQTKHPKCLGRYITDKRALAAAKAARKRLINRTTERIIEALVHVCETKADLVREIRAILEDVL